MRAGHGGLPTAAGGGVRAVCSCFVLSPAVQLYLPKFPCYEQASFSFEALDQF